MASFTATPANWDVTTDANFRAWGSYISARMAAVGLIQTADTGQVNWTTVLRPTVINTYMGYEIWRLADTLQSTFPVYYKIQYGAGPIATQPSIRVQFGSGSDGVGNLTGNLSTVFEAGCPAVAGACVVRGSGSTSRFCMNGGFTTAGGYGMWFGFERSKDGNGNDTSEAILWLANNSSNSSAASAKNVSVWSTTLGMLGTETNMGCLFPSGATMASGTQTMVAPIFHNKGIFMNPGINFIGYYPANIAINGTPTVYMYGLPRVYYTFDANSAGSSSGFRGTGGGTAALAIRYD